MLQPMLQSHATLNSPTKEYKYHYGRILRLEQPLILRTDAQYIDHEATIQQRPCSHKSSTDGSPRSPRLHLWRNTLCTWKHSDSNPSAYGSKAGPAVISLSRQALLSLPRRLASMPLPTFCLDTAKSEPMQMPDAVL